MKENFEVDINKLTEEEKEKFLELVKKGNEVTLRKRWRNKENGIYYSISNCGEIMQEVDDMCNYDEQCHQFGNYFKTKEEAEFARNKQHIYQQLNDYALEHNTKEIDWDNSHQNKWFISYSHISDELCIGSRQSVEFLNTVYFTSGEIAVNAIKEIGEENIKYYLFGIED